MAWPLSSHAKGREFKPLLASLEFFQNYLMMKKNIVKKKPAEQFNGEYEIPNPHWARIETMAQALPEACAQQWDYIGRDNNEV